VGNGCQSSFEDPLLSTLAEICELKKNIGNRQMRSIGCHLFHQLS